MATIDECPMCGSDLDDADECTLDTCISHDGDDLNDMTYDPFLYEE